MTTNAEGQSNPFGYGTDLQAEKPFDQMVLYEKVGHIAKITLNRPERHNALFGGMGEELHRKIEMAEDDDEVKVVVLSGNGASFCAGADLRRPPAEAFGLRKGQRLPQSLRMRGVSRGTRSGMGGILYSSKTTIAAVQGAALAGGFHIVLNCDLIVAADNAVFGEPEARIGFGGFSTSLPLLLLRLGINRGYEALITGRKISAQEMKDWGVVASVVPEDGLMDEAMRYAKAVAAHATDGLMLGRHAMQMFWDLMGYPQWNSFFRIGHPLFTNLVWREDEFNFLRERNKTGLRDAMARRNKIWEDLGFG